MSTSTKPIATLNPVFKDKDSNKVKKLPVCTSLTWNALGKKLFAGFSDGLIRVWHVNSSAQ